MCHENNNERRKDHHDNESSTNCSRRVARPVFQITPSTWRFELTPSIDGECLSAADLRFRKFHQRSLSILLHLQTMLGRKKKVDQTNLRSERNERDNKNERGKHVADTGIKSDADQSVRIKTYDNKTPQPRRDDDGGL